MSPAPSSSRNRRSANLANIPPPSGPPPPPPQLGYSNSVNHGQGYSSTSHSSHSSFSSQSGQLNVNAAGQLVYPGGPSSYEPPRASFSSSRASPVNRVKSGREREREQDAWSDGNWRSIFDAALVKAQQAVQLDELQETTLAANLYAQAANDLGRVIPMCSSEKKKQSMLAIQAIYLDRVSQLKEAALNKNGGIVNAPVSHSASLSESRDAGYNQRHSVSSHRGGPYGGDLQQYPQQQYQPQAYQPPLQQQRYPQQQTRAPQSQNYQGSSPQQYAPTEQRQSQQYQLPFQQVQQPDFQQQQQQQDQQDKGFRLFGKKRSKTQPSALQPPQLGPGYPGDFNSQRISISNNGSSGNNNGPNGYPPYGGYETTGNNIYSAPYVAPPRTPSPPPVLVSPVFMSNPPPQGQQPIKSPLVDSTQQQELLESQPQEQPVKSSKWKPFGKKKSKSFSTNDESVLYNAPREAIPVMPVFSPSVASNAPAQHLVDPADHADAYSHRNEADWYVESTPEEEFEDEYENQDQYYDEEDEEVDPYYVADTKGRARPFEGQESTKSDMEAEAPKEHLQSGPLADEQVYTSNFTDDADDESIYHNIPGSSFMQLRQEPQQLFHDAEDLPEEEPFAQEIQQTKAETKSTVVVPFVSAFTEHIGEIEAAPMIGPELELAPEQKAEPVLEKSKSKRTWYGKKKKEKEKDSDRLDNVAKLMDEALFGGGSSRKSSKDTLKEKGSVASLNRTVSHVSRQQDESPIQPYADLAERVSDPVAQEVIEDTKPAIEEPVSVIEEPSLEIEATLPDQKESIATETDATAANDDAPKRTKSRHFSIFRSKKNKEDKEAEPMPEGSPLTPMVTNDDSKSMHSHHTRQSSQSTDRKATEMAAALAVRPKEKEIKKRDSDEYVPYEYQEDLEGPLMERVEVRENREIFGFVLPVEEIIDYTMEENEEAALENWDSWVSQLESFEKVLSDKGLKKEKAKKPKKVKEPKPAKEDALSPLGSAKANRSSIFGLGRSDTLKSRASTTLDLSSTAMDSRPLSLSTTLMDDASIAPRLSFHSSRSGESETPTQYLATQQNKKRWWSPKRKETNSLYRASNAFSMADLEQDRRLSTLLLSQDQVKSSDDLTLDTQMMSMPIILTEPSTPAPELSKEAPAAMETVPMQDQAELKEKEKEPQEDEEEASIAPMPKVKAKSNKPKLLPISTPLPQLLKMDNAEELWLYVQQAKTYATSRMNKGDKRSAAIALKRAQALESRWQEILLEMASSDEDTDGLLEEDDEDEEEESEEKVVVVPVKKGKKIKETIPTQASIASPESITPPKPTTTITTTNTPNTPNDIEDEDDDEEEDYAAQRRKNTISRSNSTPDKYSKYKVNKVAAPNSPNVSSSLAIVTEEETNEQGELSVKNLGVATAAVSHDDGRLGPDATLEEMLESTNADHLKFYIQRMKTDTVAKARSGSKFAALEGMKNVKILQQRLDDLHDRKDEVQDKKPDNENENEIREKEEKEKKEIKEEMREEQEEQEEKEEVAEKDEKEEEVELKVEDHSPSDESKAAEEPAESMKSVSEVADVSEVVLEKEQEQDTKE